MKINKEGYTILSVTFLLFAAIGTAWFLWLPAIPAWILTVALFIFYLCIVSFFREPRRPHLLDSDLVYAPADGRVVVVEPVREKEYFGDERIQVSVFMSVTNVHVNWYPVGGEVVYTKYHPGKFLVAWHPKSSEENERMTTVVDTGSHRILFRQIAGMVARRIVTYAKIGRHMEQNTKLGFIKFGSRVDIFLPPDSEVLVSIGQLVTGSQTPIARLR